MTRPTFVQRSRLGSAIFQIEDDTLEVVENSVWRKGKTLIPLRHLNADCARVSRAMPILLVAPFAIMLLGCTGVWWLLQQDDLPHTLVLWPATFALTGLYAAAVNSPAVTYFEFKDHWARVRFRIFRERAQAAECDAFVAELALRIQAAHGELSGEPLRELLAEGPYAAHERRPPTVRDVKGATALVCGVLANAVLFLPDATPTNGAFLLLFPLVCGALVAGIFAVQEIGRTRLLGIVGMTLAILPLFAG